MGYYTYFTLKVHKDNRLEFTAEETQKLVEEINTAAKSWEYWSYGGDSFLDYFTLNTFDDDCVHFTANDEMKWYESEENIGSFAEEHPELIFELYGGAEDGYEWTIYYHGDEREYDEKVWVLGKVPDKFYTRKAEGE